MTGHVIRPTRNGWACSCGTKFTSSSTAEDHAFSVQGRIELGAVTR